MQNLTKIITDIIIVVTILGTIFFLYQTYGQSFLNNLLGQPKDTIFINDLSIEVTMALTAKERRQGLSGVDRLGEREGKLFVFDESGRYGIWMKDMNFAIDVFWIDENLRIVHIEENVLPSTYPAVFNTPEPARFILETNAFFADTFGISLGDRVGITANDLPADLREGFTE